MVRAFFAHRRWLVALLAVGGGGAAVGSMTIPTTFIGRMELACSPDAPPSRVVLPDVVRLRQLVFDPENLSLLLDSEDPSDKKGAALVESLAETATLEPISPPTAPSSVWRLRVEIPAPDRATAQRRLEQYADRINQDFRERIRLVRRGDPAGIRTAPTVSEILPARYQPADEKADVSLLSEVPPTPQAAPAEGNPLAELASRFGVSVEQLPAVADSIRSELDRRANEIAARERQVDEWVEIVNGLESGEAHGAASTAERGSPSIRSLLERREELQARRLNLVGRLRPAHPDYQAVERSIQEVETRLRLERERLADSYRARIAEAEASTKQLRNELSKDRRRLDALEAAAAGRRSREAAPPSSFAASAAVAPPEPAPPLSGRALPTTWEAERPIGRVVLPGASVDRRPIRPKTVRNTVAAMACALLAYLVFVAVQAGSDPRVFGVDDLESLGIDLYVFGSIPASKRCVPVRLVQGDGERRKAETVVGNSAASTN
jgi:hypothetical protein